MPPPGRGEPWCWAGVPEMPSLGHHWLVPGSSAALTLTLCPSPNICFAFPYSLHYFSPSGGQTAHHVFPKKAIPTCPIYLWKGRAHSLSWPGHSMSLQMGDCTLELGPTGGKRKALGMALSVTLCWATLSNQKRVGHLHYPGLRPPGVSSKGISHS